MADVEVRGLSKAFGGNRVLDRVAFRVEDGRFCILLGPSGCGKTTLLRIVAGLEAQDEGAVLIGGRDVGALAPRDRDVAMVFQSYALYPHMSVFDNLAFPLRARRTPREEIRRRVQEAATLLGIADLLDRKPRQLSGGQRQRVAIGRAIVRRPQAFLFDEPLSNLDAKLRAGMRVELARLHRALGATILYVTHDQVEAMTLGDTIVLLEGGRIQQQGTPRELYERPRNLFVAAFIGSPSMNLVEGRVELREGQAVFVSGGIRVPLGDPARLGGLSPGPLTLGVRPEALRPGSGGPVRGRVEVVEHLGSETLVHAEVEGKRLVAKVRARWEGAPGEGTAFALDPAGVHLFRDGLRVGGVGAGSGRDPDSTAGG
ncbi:MAG: sn-glycerol-3-phosphate ABC transporter ATP-binding protein UgpC [Deferrisomatales bacterium]